ncbi:ADP-ribose pyrophosphatase [Clostridium aceticum]|uniref:ADP-ribose pyrophosphatase n=1 Tax=Clostridium aceticum TaxID=84022 RepID=A0A0D8ICN7_9CLOT|nr:NUDIX hydrolase [Clostridium aceticum]AKL94816.1 ADP-ribose pyrophosphatase [Clostridium aceticum]KJF27752.1 hypothetical protein TZ02_03880 [Clostridium aceticum]
MRFEFCPKCGGKLSINDVKEINKPKCVDCGFVFYQNPIVGVAAIVLQEGKVLLGKRNSSYSGTWCIPCGYVEWDEDVYEAVAREFQEETGLHIKTKEIFHVLSNFHNPKQHTVGIWFLAEVVDGSLAAGDDLDKVDYFYYEDIPVLAFPTDRIVIDKLYELGLIK